MEGSCLHNWPQDCSTGVSKKRGEGYSTAAENEKQEVKRLPETQKRGKVNSSQNFA